MSLETCDSNHDQIVYECSGRSKCPVCTLIEERDKVDQDHESTIADLNSEIGELTDKVAELEGIIETSEIDIGKPLTLNRKNIIYTED